MAYNNGFPMGYQPVQMTYPQYQQPTYNQQTMTPTIHADIVQVENEDAATRFPVGAGSSQMMIAKDDSAIFIKTAFTNGQSSMDVFVKRPPAPAKPQLDLSNYITREELEARLKELTGGVSNESV